MATLTDNSSGAMQLNSDGLTYRGIGADWFNSKNITAEDWNLNELAAVNAFDRESQFNAAEAQKQRDFEERMSSTAYQRAVADMKAAGLNPVLLASSQGGASTPQGTSASVSSSYSAQRNGMKSDTAKFAALLLGLATSLITGKFTGGSGSSFTVKGFSN